MRLCDKFVRSALLFLLLFTPLAFGTVHAWAYSLMEGIGALMVFAWALKIWSLRKAPVGFTNMRTWPYALPLVLFIAYVVFQLVPLPPKVLQTISPATYEVYTKALPGWPEQIPYADLLALAADEKESGRQEYGETTGQGEVSPVSRLRSPVNAQHSEPRTPNPESRTAASWLPLSISPTLTRSDLLKLTTYTLLFFLVLFYPAPGAVRDPYRRAEYEIDFVRPVVYTILFAGFLVATLGFLNLFTWNGKVLWFFVPYDVTGGGGGARAAAPFIAPPSFANYLAMTLPLMLVATFARTFLTPVRFGPAFRVLCGFGVFIMFCGILLSLSRAGWAAAALGVGVLMLVMAFGKAGKSWLARTPMRRLVTFGVAASGLFLLIVMVFVGPRGQEGLDQRLQETATEAKTLQGRVAVWRDSMGMVRDFPVVGVGLGAWADLFPRYQNPRVDGFYRETHNDYLELLAETGLVGAVLLASFFALCCIRIMKRAFSLDESVFPIVAALVAGMSAMTFHEAFDFNLQIPANAILFTILLALALRLVSVTDNRQRETNDGQQATGNRATQRLTVQNEFPMPTRPVHRIPGLSSPVSRRPQAVWAALGLGMLATLLFLSAFSQRMAPYPYYLRKEAALPEALERVTDHPANADSHIALFDAAKKEADTTWQLAELTRILWLAPRKTNIRDIYASRLIVEGRKAEALEEVSRSVYDSPSIHKHFYLSPTVAPTLLADEQRAVERGLRKAIGEDHAGALYSLAHFYARTQRPNDQAALYEEAAASSPDPGIKADYLLKAADAAIRAEDLSTAEKSLLEATRLEPDNTAHFIKLITRVYLPRKDLDGAREAVAQGIQNGADAMTLQIALAQAAQQSGEKKIAATALQDAMANEGNGSGDIQERFRSYIRLARIAGSLGENEVQEEALYTAIQLQPNSYEALVQVGSLQEAREDYTRAAFYYRKATRVNPRSVGAFARLATLEEKRFRFADADKAYATAVGLAPKNEGLRKRYEAFKRKLAKGKDGGPKKTGDGRQRTGN